MYGKFLRPIYILIFEKLLGWKIIGKKPDYKKMSLSKLKEVIVEKGIVADASKLKKNDILKLLGVE